MLPSKSCMHSLEIGALVHFTVKLKKSSMICTFWAADVPQPSFDADAIRPVSRVNLVGYHNAYWRPAESPLTGRKREGNLWYFLFPSSFVKASEVRLRSVCLVCSVGTVSTEPRLPQERLWSGETIYGRHFTSFWEVKSFCHREERWLTATLTGREAALLENNWGHCGGSDKERQEKSVNVYTVIVCL